MPHRRPARDYEILLARSEAAIAIAMTDLMARRLADEATRRDLASEPNTHPARSVERSDL